MRHTKLLPLLAVLLGCATTEYGFVPEASRSFTPKPASYEMPAFFEDHRPEREYEVIGMIYVTETAPTKFDRATVEEVVRGLKLEARRRGADAIIDVKIIPDEDTPQWRKRGEAKAVVFEDT